MKKEETQENKNININTVYLMISLIIVFICAMYYYFSRGYVSNLQDFLMNGDNLMGPISAGTFSSITSAFSIAYGLGQPIGGFLLDRIGVKFLAPFLLAGAAISTYFFSNYTNPQTAIYLRYLIGACFCISSIGSSKYLSIFWSKYFSVLVNLLPVCMCLAASFAASNIIKNTMVLLGWRNFLKIYAYIGVILSVLLFFLYMKIVKPANVIDKNNQDSEEKVSFIEGLKNIIQLPGILWVSIFSIAISGAAYTLMDGWGNALIKLKFPNNSISPASINMVGNAIGFIYNIFADKFMNIKKQMFVYSIISIGALGAIIYCNLGLYGILTAIFFLGFTCAAQNIGFVFLQRKLKVKYLGLGFGVLNFLCMYLGCAFIQQITGTLLDIIKNKNVLIVGFYEGYKYIDLINVFKFLLIPSILTLVATLMFKEKK